MIIELDVVGIRRPEDDSGRGVRCTQLMFCRIIYADFVLPPNVCPKPYEPPLADAAAIVAAAAAAAAALISGLLSMF